MIAALSRQQIDHTKGNIVRFIFVDDLPERLAERSLVLLETSRSATRRSEQCVYHFSKALEYSYLCVSNRKAELSRHCVRTHAQKKEVKRYQARKRKERRTITFQKELHGERRDKKAFSSTVS